MFLATKQWIAHEEVYPMRKPLPKLTIVSAVHRTGKYGEPITDKGWDITPKEAQLVYDNQKSLEAFLVRKDNDIEPPLEVRKLGYQENRILCIPYRGSDREMMFGEAKAALLSVKMDDIEQFLYKVDPVFRNMIDKRRKDEEAELKAQEEAKLLAELEAEAAQLKNAA